MISMVNDEDDLLQARKVKTSYSKSVRNYKKCRSNEIIQYKMHEEGPTGI